MDLWLPQQIDAEREALVERPAGNHLRDALERELRQLDDNLRLGYIGDRAPEIDDIIPGCWHVIRLNPDTVNTFFPIATPEGEPLPLSFQLVEDMKARDLWKPGAMKRLAERRRRMIEDRRKRVELAREQQRDEAAVSYRAAKRVAGDGGMTRRRWAKGLVGG